MHRSLSQRVQEKRAHWQLDAEGHQWKDVLSQDIKSEMSLKQRGGQTGQSIY